MTEIARRYRAEMVLGRIGTLRIELEAVLAVSALAGIVFVPAIGKLGALLILAAGVALLALRYSQTLALALRNPVLIVLPLFCILSFTWSRDPALSLRFGLQLAATVAITIALCTRLSARSFCIALFCLLGLAMLASALVGQIRSDIGAWVGIYGSKNAFAGSAATFAVIAFGVALLRGAGWHVRAAGVVGTVLGIVFVVLAKSVGAIVFLIPTLLTMLLLMLAGRLSTVRALTAFTFIGLVSVLGALALHANIDSVSEYVLDQTGKDLTLTGRTELWRIAQDLIAERPLLGVGYQAFWLKGNSEAETLWFMFGIEAESGFHFHNMYLSNAVEIGILGVLIQSLVLFGALVLTGCWAVRGGGAVAATFFAMTLMAVMGSLIEVPVFFQFSIRSLLVVAAFIYAREALSGRG